MKIIKLFAAALAASTMAGSAFAADLPSRKEAPVYIAPAPVFSWTGFYLGADLGYAWQSLNTTFGAWGNVGSNVNPNGIIGGGYIGYNYQVAPSFVIGLEGDIEGGSVKQNRNVLGLATAGFVGTGLAVFGNNISVTNDFRASIRARAGMSFDRALLYATGGFAFANFNTRMSWGNAWSENWNNGRAGWTVGAGGEYAFTPNWVGRIEYRFSQFGTSSRYSALAGYTISQRMNDNAVRVGVGYKFGGYSAPTVARY
jgi:outer membrane immunogenic protein